MSKYDNIDDAAKHGDIDAVKYMYSIGQKCTSDALENAASNGDLEMVKYLISVNVPCYIFVINNAAINGHLNVVKYLYSIGKRYSILAIEKACTYGHIDIVNFDIFGVHDVINTKLIKRNAMKNALFGGHMEIVKLLQKFVDIPVDAINIAAHSGNLELVKYLYNIGEDYDLINLERIGNAEIIEYFNSMDKSNIVQNIVESTIILYSPQKDKEQLSPINLVELNGGHIQTVDYLYTNDMDCVIDFINYSAIKGDIITIKYLYNKYGVCNLKAMYNAAENGHSEICMYLHNHAGIRYNTKVAIIAAKKGYIDIIKHIDKCYMSDDVVKQAVANNHINIVKYLYSVYGIDCSNTAYTAVRSGNIDMIDYLVSINVDFYKFSSKNEILDNYLSKYTSLYK